MARRKNKCALNILLNGDLVGFLDRSSAGAMTFQYAASWLSSDRAQPLSYSLPLREDSYRDERVHAYFDNLLPDNTRMRELVSAKVRAESAGTFDLLAAIGRDCVGAIQCVPESEEIAPPMPIRGTPLSDVDIARVLRNLQTNPLGLNADREFRISIAGAQEKTAFLRWKNRWHLTEGGTPTTHIFKPTIGKLRNGIDFSDSVQNEWLCLKIASHFGLDVAKAEMLQFDGVDCLVVERFDRRWSKDKRHLSRVPQEDLCQALGLPSSLKYESDGGPGILKIMNLLNASDNRDHDREQFFKAQIVLFLLGAIDGHAKNFSVFLGRVGFHLAPLYDILSIHPALTHRQIEVKEARMAMCVGANRHYQLREIRRRHWEQTAKACGLQQEVLVRIFDEVHGCWKGLDTAMKNIVRGLPSSLVDSIFEGVTKGVKAMDLGSG